MSNFPSMRLVSWKTEFGVGVSFTSIPFFANRPFSCATQMGQLKPPGKTMTLTVTGALEGVGAGGVLAHEARPIARTTTRPRMTVLLSLLHGERIGQISCVPS